MVHFAGAHFGGFVARVFFLTFHEELAAQFFSMVFSTKQYRLQTACSPFI
jgi:hypothetical protein